MNEHLCCLYLDHFLSSSNIQCVKSMEKTINSVCLILGAAKVAVYVMQQEMFASPLLNFLASNALLRWTESEHSERVFDAQIHPRVAATIEDELDFTEENVVSKRSK